MERELSWPTLGGASLQRSMWVPVQGRAGPLYEDQGGPRRRPRSLDGQPPGGLWEGRTRRDEKVKRKSRKSRGRSKAGRQVSEKEEEEEEKGGGRNGVVFKFQRTGQEEKEEKEKEEERERKDASNQELGGGLRHHSFGPPSNGEEENQKESKKPGEAEKEGFIWDSDRLREQQQQRGRPGGVQHLRRRGKGEESGGEIPRGLDFEHHRADAKSGGDSHGSDVGPGHRNVAPHLHHVLAAGAEGSDVRSYGPRGSDTCLPGGLPFARQGESGLRRGHSEIEISGADGGRSPFLRSSKGRTDPRGSSADDHASRELGSSPVAERGCKSPHRSSTTLGEKRRLRPTCGSTERHRKRERQTGQRKTEERRQPECSRKQGRETEAVRSTGELADSVTGASHCNDLRRGEVGREGSSEGRLESSTPTHGRVFSSGPLKEATDSNLGGLFAFSPDGMTLGGMAKYFQHALCNLVEVFCKEHSKVQSSGGVFPLPDAPVAIADIIGDASQEVVQVLRMMASALNSYYGVRWTEARFVTKASREALRAMRAYADDIVRWPEKFEVLSWDDMLQVRTVDYRGEEIRLAKSICWENIEPALPDCIGQIPLDEVCELGTLDFVLRFDDYLVPPESRVYTKPPRVMVEEGSWEQICSGLLAKGVCQLLPKGEVYHVDDKPVLNGMFGVTKSEFSNGWEVYRLIMNLIPVNKLVRPMGGDVCTLPAWSGMTPYLLEDSEVIVMSSEDIRCFFYLFAIPESWKKYMCFNKVVPPGLHPGNTETHYLCSRVLPMGFVNSVSIAQHVHRRIARLSLHSITPGVGPSNEIRKDKSLFNQQWLYRIYLDNFDTLQRMDKQLAEEIQGEVSVEVLALRSGYELIGLPRHPKKSVQQMTGAEIQGAWVDGVSGRVRPKASKVLKYVCLTWLLLQEGRANQKQLQIVAGGLVYCAMFRRALLGMLNSVWRFIVEFSNDPPVIKREIPGLVQLELVRFICAVPLAQMNLRAPMLGAVTASDASEYGGGFCVSKGLTAMGTHAAQCQIRGDFPELEDHVQVLAIGLFDGIGAFRVAADVLHLPMAGHVSSEVSKEGRRVLESNFPDTWQVGAVEDITLDLVTQWALRYCSVGVVIVGGGPPCQGVSGLNSDRKGALKDARSNLFVHVPRVFELCRQVFKWAQVHRLMESVFSMDAKDRSIMSEALGVTPYMVDASGITACRRPRLYWLSWTLQEGQGVTIQPTTGEGWEAYQVVELKHDWNSKDFFYAGWDLVQDVLPTFTTARPRPKPGNRPAGLWQCSPEERSRWEADLHRYPPYVYRDIHMLWDQHGNCRLPRIQEKEVIMGFPCDYTAACKPKSEQHGDSYWDCRHTLIGNTWNVPVVAWLLKELTKPLGLTEVATLEEVTQSCVPGGSKSLQSFLQRPPLYGHLARVPATGEEVLSRKLLHFVSIKGEDLMLQAASENQVKFHRLRTSIPARLWKWRAVCGWPWRLSGFHINVLEMQAVLTTLQWRVRKRQNFKCRFLHLTDSLVTLHSLSRGRSSSRKLRSVLSKINATLLACDLHPVWGYVSTKQNPADRPSRRPVLKQWVNLLLLFGCPGCPFFGGFLVLFFSYSFRGFYLTPILVSRPDHPQVDATGHLMAQILYLIQKKKGILTYLNGIAHGSSTSCQNPPTGQYVAFCVAG